MTIRPVRKMFTAPTMVASTRAAENDHASP
jgi:hypothetical protein